MIRRTLTLLALAGTIIAASGCDSGETSYQIPASPEAESAAEGEAMPTADPTADPSAETVVEVAEAVEEMPAATGEATSPYGGEFHTIPGTIEAEHYDEGPAGVAYADIDEKNQGVPYRENTQVDIEERADASNGHGVGWARAGEWLTYTVNVTVEGTYTVDIPVASNGSGGTFHLEIDDSDVTGPIQVPDTGGWGNLQPIRAEGVLLLAGSHTLKLVMDTTGESGATGDVDCLIFALAE